MRERENGLGRNRTDKPYQGHYPFRLLDIKSSNSYIIFRVLKTEIFITLHHPYKF